MFGFIGIAAAFVRNERKGLFLAFWTLGMAGFYSIVAAVNIALNFLLIPRWGMVGAGWATVIAYLFMNWFRWYMSTRYHPVPYEWGRIAKLVGLATIMYCAIVLVPIENHYLSFAIRFLVAATYPFLLALLGFFDERERVRLRELWSTGRARLRPILSREKNEP